MVRFDEQLNAMWRCLFAGKRRPCVSQVFADENDMRLIVEGDGTEARIQNFSNRTIKGANSIHSSCYILL